MKRSPLGPGAKSVERGSTFASRGQGIDRSVPLVKRSSRPAKRSFTPASEAQRAKVADLGSIVSGHGPCDPAHLCPRSRGGCDHPDCVVPLMREEHRAFDDGKLDLLPHLLNHACFDELAHMIAVHHVDPISLLQRVTGERWEPA